MSGDRQQDIAAYDVIYASGLIIDGTGAPGFQGDLGIRGDRIAAIGDLSAANCADRIDCSGRVVAPGFIDAHTHDDTMVLIAPQMLQKTSQGVTTVIAGNCGISLAPARMHAAPPPPLDLIGSRETYDFPTMASYLDRLDATPPAVNVAILTGHMSLRATVMDDVDRPATDDEIEQMAKMLKESLASGSIGLSTGLAYKPSHAAAMEEIVALASVAGSADCLHATHMRDESDAVIPSIQEACEIGRMARVATVISHHKLLGIVNHGRSAATLELLEDLRTRQPLAIDCYPYIASSTVLKRDRVMQSSSVLITWSKSMPEAEGKYLADIAASLDCTVDEAIERLNPAGAIYFVLSEEDVSRILSWPETMIGSDGIPQDSFPHPRLWGTFPRVLGHYVRDGKLMSLSEAVRKMTSLTADNFGLKDRGRLRPGAYADVVIFDPETILDKATYTDPIQRAIGLDRVMVNGTEVWRDNASTGALPGRALRRQDQLAPMLRQRAHIGERH